MGAASAFHGNRRSASRSLSFYKLYSRFRVLRVVVLRVVRSTRPPFSRHEEMRGNPDDKARPFHGHVMCNPYLWKGDVESSR